MPNIRPHLERNLAQAEALGQTERAKKLKARIAEIDDAPEAPSLSNTKAELLAAADLAGVAVDESMTKAEILELLEG
jgi:hypothetical protein